jgi:hypothetical protein
MASQELIGKLVSKFNQRRSRYAARPEGKWIRGADGSREQPIREHFKRDAGSKKRRRDRRLAKPS